MGLRDLTPQEAAARLDHVRGGGLSRDLNAAVDQAVRDGNFAPVWTLLRDQARRMRELAQHLERRAVAGERIDLGGDR